MHAMSLSHLVLLTSYILFASVTETECGGANLGEYIKHFSALHYDTSALHQKHLATKQSFYDKGINLPLSFKGRALDLSLHPASDGIYHPATKISVDGVESIFDQNHLYTGHIKGDPKSFVSGSIIKGVFQGLIRTGANEVFYVDRKEYHPAHPHTAHQRVHSVIYRKDDVDVNKFHELRRAKRSNSLSDGVCGRNNPKTKHWMDNIEDSGSSQDTKPHTGKSGRRKRATEPSKNTCNLFLQSDPEMWIHMQKTLETTDETMIRQEISAYFSDLIREVNGIYKNTDFNGQKGFEFRVDRIAINKTCSKTSDHWFCNKDLDVANFLNLNTYTNHNDYCLAYILTYRDFADGTLGLAWVARPGSLLGGVCSRYITYSEQGSRRKKSLNTGIVTVKNYGARVPKLMSQLTLAHEIGHNFGSEHDPTGSSMDCTPYKDNNNQKGNFIMYYAAISGKRDNNYKFSNCSVKNISKVLSSSRNTACFKGKTDGWCGNEMVEKAETCDCGYCPASNPDCCSCCVGQNNANDAKDACSLKPGLQCDPSQGPCCTSTCNYHSSGFVCRKSTTCSKKAICGGSAHTCPVSVHEADETVCNDNTQICVKGACTGSICARINGGDWEECSSSSADEGMTAASLCTISCKEKGKDKCYSSFNVATLPTKFKDMLKKVNNGSYISAKAGQPCDKDQGFCDYMLQCRKIDDLGPLARLKDLLLSFTSIEELTAWLKVNWWIVVIAVLGLILFMGLLIKFGTVFTPSSNPEKSANRKPSKPFTKPENTRRRDAAREPLQAAGPTIGGRRGDDIEMHAK